MSRAPATPRRRLKAPPVETPIPWLPGRTTRFSGSTPDKLVARYHRAQSQIKQFTTGGNPASAGITHLPNDVNHMYMRAKFTMVTNKARDKQIAMLLEIVEDAEFEAAMAKLQADITAENDRLALHHVLTGIYHGKWPRVQRPVKTVRHAEAARTEAARPQARRRLEEPPTPPGVPFLPQLEHEDVIILDAIEVIESE